MNTIYWCFPLLFLCLACGEHASEHPSSENDRSSMDASGPKLSLEDFLAGSTQITADSFLVSSLGNTPVWETAPPMDSTWYTQIQQFYSTQGIHTSSPLYLHAYFKLHDGNIGFLLLLQGRYVPSVVDLCVYDPDAQKFVHNIHLADDWGDAGFFTQKKSLIQDIDQDGKLDIVSWKQEFVPSFHNEAYTLLRGRLLDSTFVYRGNGRSFNNVFACAAVDSVSFVVHKRQGNIQRIVTLHQDSTFFYPQLSKPFVDKLKTVKPPFEETSD